MRFQFICNRQKGYFTFVAVKKQIIKDHIRIIKLLRPSVVWNALQLRLSFYLSRLLKKTIHMGMPLHISVEPTTSCNLRCPECPSGLRAFSRPTGMLTLNVFESQLNQLKAGLASINFYFQGEPFLNKELLPMIAMAAQKGIYTATSTNAHYFDDERAKETILSGLHRLIISIDGTSQETYSAYRVGGQLSKVIEGTKRVIEWKKKLKSATPHIIFQFLVVRQNEDQLNEILQLASQLGIDELRFKTAQVYDYTHGNPLIPQNEDYSRYRKQKDGTWSLKNKFENHCWRMWQGCVITWDGSVVPCCFDKDAQHQLGSTAHMPFKTIWKSAAYNTFRKAVLNNRKEIEICSNCSEGSKVWA